MDTVRETHRALKTHYALDVTSMIFAYNSLRIEISQETSKAVKEVINPFYINFTLRP